MVLTRCGGGVGRGAGDERAGITETGQVAVVSWIREFDTGQESNGGR